MKTVPREKQNTLFIDIDGTLVLHQGYYDDMIANDMVILDGVLEFLRRMREDNTLIFLTTARLEKDRERTEEQLAAVGIVYDKLIMECGAGKRLLINDDKPDMEHTASAVTVKRNMGLAAFL